MDEHDARIAMLEKSCSALRDVIRGWHAYADSVYAERDEIARRLLASAQLAERLQRELDEVRAEAAALRGIVDSGEHIVDGETDEERLVVDVPGDAWPVVLSRSEIRALLDEGDEVSADIKRRMRASEAR